MSKRQDRSTNGASIDRGRPARAAAPLALLALAWLSGCGESSEAPAPAPDWAEVLEARPDPEVVTDAELRAAIEATGLPWRVRHLASGIELLLVPPHEYERGAAEGDPEAAADERPRHRVRIERPFWIGRFEVTQAEWEAVMGTNPSHFAGEATRPVEQVTMLEVREFLERTDLALPSEAQWEAAARAGEAGARYGALDDIAWHRDNAGSRTHAVGSKGANALGLHDVLGNVWEWTSTWYDPAFYATVAQGAGQDDEPPGGVHAVLRGGSWYDPLARLRLSARYHAMWTFKAGHVGFRVAIE